DCNRTVTNDLNIADIAAGTTNFSGKPSNAAATSVNDLGNKDTFLQLLVAQLKNQDPLKPTDGVQFVTQLAQFSSLEQLIGIRSDLKNLTPATPTGTSTTDPTTTPTTQP